uniref:C2H2-type domain-containing protein n=1 Tax=Petromyzon marinus TaxID=7757 RepID=S4RF04_PETMA
CGKSFGRAWDLAQHRRPHGFTPAGRAASSGASTRRRYSGWLAVHRCTHMGEKRHSVRGTAGARSAVRLSPGPTSSSHLGEKPNTCSSCGLAFRVKHHLTRHQRKHV